MDSAGCIEKKCWICALTAPSLRKMVPYLEGVIELFIYDEDEHINGSPVLTSQNREVCESQSKTGYIFSSS
jgi:hypothetical protein